jgi:hypothetical protein
MRDAIASRTCLANAGAGASTDCPRGEVAAQERGLGQRDRHASEMGTVAASDRRGAAGARVRRIEPEPRPAPARPFLRAGRVASTRAGALRCGAGAWRLSRRT